MQIEIVLIKIYIDSGEASFKVLSSILEQIQEREANANHGNKMLAGVKRFVSKRIH